MSEKSHQHHEHGHSHEGGHGHDHTHHSHAPTVNVGNARAVAWAAALTGSFMLAEVAGGIVSGSLALLADAAHMVTDFAALLLAWLGFQLARAPAGGRASYGQGRFTILAAFANGLMLFPVAGWIIYEAILRLLRPEPVIAGTMLVIAVLGLLVNIAAFWILSRAEKDNLNIRGALIHVAGDLFGSVAAIFAALVIQTTGWFPVDPLLSILVALIILRSGWHVLYESGKILLEHSPLDVEESDLEKSLVAHVDGLESVHHLHIWSLTEKRSMATLHAALSSDADAQRVRFDIRQFLDKTHGIGHVTIESEAAGERCADQASD